MRVVGGRGHSKKCILAGGSSRKGPIHMIKGQEHIFLYLKEGDKSPMQIRRKPRKDQLACNHVWCATAHRGHGKWARGCRLCGALGR